jgi:hypothetical protein
MNIGNDLKGLFTNPLKSLLTSEMPGSWADWALDLANSGKVGDSGEVIKLADRLAKSAAISVEAAAGLLLWLGSVCMLQHTRVQWPSGIWQPAGLALAVVEDDSVPIDSITNAFIQLVQKLGIDPIHDTVKEGPAGLIARLESAGQHEKIKTDTGTVKVDSLAALAQVDTSGMQSKRGILRGNSRALIYPSGRALLSYLYDTPFFNTLDELIQHGNLTLRGKISSHKLTETHMSLIVNFYQGALVTLTNDNRVQNNMTALLRQMLVLWPTSGTRRYTEGNRIDVALNTIENRAREGLKHLEALTDGRIQIPNIPSVCAKPLLQSEGAGIRYTILNRHSRISKIALAVSFWRIVAGGNFEITQGDLAMAESILHLHEMGGRLFELVMSKGRLGHEFMRIFLTLLDGGQVSSGEEIAHASELNVGATATQRLGDLSILSPEHKLADEYRFITGDIIASHRNRWQI